MRLALASVVLAIAVGGCGDSDPPTPADAGGAQQPALATATVPEATREQLESSQESLVAPPTVVTLDATVNSEGVRLSASYDAPRRARISFLYGPPGRRPSQRTSSISRVGTGTAVIRLRRPSPGEYVYRALVADDDYQELGQVRRFRVRG